MGLFDGYLLLSDLDGTLLCRDRSISAENIDTIEFFVREGGRFSVATGRSELLVQPFAARLPVNSPMILYNGAAIYDDGARRFACKRTISRDLCGKIVRSALEESPRVCVQIFAGGPFYLVNDDGFADDFIAAENQQFIRGGLDEIEGEIMKLLFCGEQAHLQRIERRLARDFPGNGFFNLFYSDSHYLEVLPHQASKGQALKALAKLCGVRPDRTAAIGDYYNDIEMIEAVAFSAAPANAPEDVRRRAGYITRDNENGALADFILNALLPTVKGSTR